MKTCTKCKESKELSEFAKDCKIKSGLKSRCKACQTIDRREYRERNREKINADRKAYRETHKEQLKASKDKWVNSNRDKVRAYNNQYVKGKTRTNEDRRKANEYKREYNKRPGVKHKCKARYNLTNSVSLGHTVKPNTCEICGVHDNSLHGHHWSYEEVNWLSVVWCCNDCHVQIHRDINDNK